MTNFDTEAKEPFLKELEMCHPDWHDMTKAQRQALGDALVDQRYEQAVAIGMLRMMGTDDQGYKLYRATEDAVERLRAFSASPTSTGEAVLLHELHISQLRHVLRKATGMTPLSKKMQQFRYELVAHWNQRLEPARRHQNDPELPTEVHRWNMVVLPKAEAHIQQLLRAETRHEFMTVLQDILAVMDELDTIGVTPPTAH